MVTVKEVLEKNRKSLERLNKMHLDYIKSNGLEGSKCLNYQEFLRDYYNLTDKQIIQMVLDKGVEIEDAKEFLKNN